MKLLGDYHTHTTYTHGESTVEENIRQAEKLGLKEIAITEHCYKGYNHIKPGDLEKIKADIESVKDMYSVKVLLGIEANLMSRDGDLDISEQELQGLDVVILGYHRLSDFKGREKWWGIRNFLSKKPNKKLVEINTNAYLKAMDKYRINILAHLNYGCYVDCVRLAKECVKRDIYIELNGKRIVFTDQEIKDMVETGVKFLINSDAHHYTRVAKNSEAFGLIERLNIPHSQIANLDKVPKFKRG